MISDILDCLKCEYWGPASGHQCTYVEPTPVEPKRGRGRPKVGRKLTFRLGPELEAELERWQDKFNCADKTGALREMMWVAAARVKDWDQDPPDIRRAKLEALLDD